MCLYTLVSPNLNPLRALRLQAFAYFSVKMTHTQFLAAIMPLYAKFWPQANSVYQWGGKTEAWLNNVIELVCSYTHTDEHNSIS